MIPKPRKRIVNKDLIHWVLYERDRMCLYGFMSNSRCDGPLQVHHIEKRSQSGDDAEENLITLCYHHHIEGAERNLIAPKEFHRILTTLYGYQYKEIRDG